MGELIVNEVNLKQFGVTCSASGLFVAPSRDIERVSIPGRNGDIIIDKGRFNNVDVPYECYISKNFTENFARLKAFLLSASFSTVYDDEPNYLRIEDSYYPDCFRYGVLASEIVATPTPANKGGRFELSFYCQPQIFLKSGETSIVYNSQTSARTVVLNGQGGLPSLPIIKATVDPSVTSSTKTVVKINGDALILKKDAALSTEITYDGTFIYDCKTKQLTQYVDGGYNLANRRISSNAISTLLNGRNSIEIPANVKIEIIPRWWTV